MRLAEEKKIVPVLNTASYGAASAGICDSINMKNHHRATFVLTFGAITGNSVLKVFSAASDGGTSSAIAFTHAIGSAVIKAATADVLAATAAVVAASGLSLVAATYQNKMLVVDVDASQMDVANSEEWLTAIIDSTATSGICHGVAILKPRYTSAVSATATA